MKQISLLKLLVLILSLALSSYSFAIPMPPVPLEPLYFEPPVVEATVESKQLTCVQLDNAIRTLHPYRYTYKDGFYDDGFNKIAVATMTIDNLSIITDLFEGLLGFAYLGYSALVEEKEKRRVLGVEQQISMLQQLKAEKHCFE